MGLGLSKVHETPEYNIESGKVALKCYTDTIDKSLGNPRKFVAWANVMMVMMAKPDHMCSRKLIKITTSSVAHKLL